MIISAVDETGPAAEKGLQVGDVIVEIDQKAVGSPTDIERRVKEAKKNGFRVVTLLIYRGGDFQWFASASTRADAANGASRSGALKGKGGAPSVPPFFMATQRILVIGGPTASGKSAIAMELARALDGVVINADSMQVYAELPILTAQPDAAARAAVPHRLYGVLSAAEACSAARWADMAWAAIDDAVREGLQPIVVGGTGLYIRAMMRGLAPVPEIPPEIRAEARKLLHELGPVTLHARLAGRDPAGAARLQPTDPQRLARAWEVLEATGRSLTDWQAEACPTRAGCGIPAVRPQSRPRRALPRQLTAGLRRWSGGAPWRRSAHCPGWDFQRRRRPSRPWAFRNF